MKTLLFVCALAATASADPIDAIIRTRLAPVVPAGFGIAKVHVPAVLASLDVAPSSVTVEVPGELKLGRPSIKVTVRGKRTIYVPVTVGKMTEVAIVNHAVTEGDVLTAADVTIEERVSDVKEPAPAASVIGATMTRSLGDSATIERNAVVLAPPLARGTQVAIVMQRGSVRVRGTATLEVAARPGQEAVVRVGQTRTLVRGLLVAPSTVIVGEAP